MISSIYAKSLHRLAQDAVAGSGAQWLSVYRRCREAPEGDFVECGVHKGGYSLLMAGFGRAQWMFDSWEGIPEAGYEAGKGYRVKGPNGSTMHLCLLNFWRFGLLRENQFFMRGWFRDTLPRYTGEIAVLVIDGDLYSSTTECLETLYDKVVPGGYVIVDDMPLEGCRDAVLAFRERRGIDNPMFGNDDEPYEWSNGLYSACAGTWWRK